MKFLSLKIVPLTISMLVFTACTNSTTQVPKPSTAERSQVESIVIQTKRVDIATHLVQVFRPENKDISQELWNEKVAQLKTLDPILEVFTRTENNLNYKETLSQKLQMLDIGETLDAVAVIESKPEGFAIIRRVSDQNNQKTYQILFWSESRLRDTVRNLDLNR